MANQTPASDAVQSAKAWFKSKTYWGIIVMVLSFIAKTYFPEVDVDEALKVLDENSTELAAQVDTIYAQARYGLLADVGAAIGAFLTAIGRNKASGPIKLV